MIAVASISGQGARVALPAQQGLAGPPGPMGGDVLLTAGIALGGQRAVCLGSDGRAYLASADDAHCVHCFGITRCALAIGVEGAVCHIGVLDDPSFAFAIGPVFLGLAGSLTQFVPTAPAAAIRVQLGYALTPTRLFVHPRPAVILAS